MSHQIDQTIHKYNRATSQTWTMLATVFPTYNPAGKLHQLCSLSLGKHLICFWDSLGPWLLFCCHTWWEQSIMGLKSTARYDSFLSICACCSVLTYTFSHRAFTVSHSLRLRMPDFSTQGYFVIKHMGATDSRTAFWLLIEGLFLKTRVYIF